MPSMTLQAMFGNGVLIGMELLPKLASQEPSWTRKWLETGVARRRLDELCSLLARVLPSQHQSEY